VGFDVAEADSLQGPPNHEYHRRGALAYLAAYDVHHSQVDASAKRVFFIVDNGSSHRGQVAVDRLAARHPNAVMIHTPVHASWLNQVQICVSIVQPKVLTPNDFSDLTTLEQRLMAFQDRYNATAKPFTWRYTAADLHEQLAQRDTSDTSQTHAA
jgi:hypothetical protein